MYSHEPSIVEFGQSKMSEKESLDTCATFMCNPAGVYLSDNDVHNIQSHSLIDIYAHVVTSFSHRKMRKKAPVVEPTLGSGSRCEVNNFDGLSDEKSRFEPRGPAISSESRPSLSSSTPLHIMDLLPVFYGKIQSPITHTTSELLLVHSQVPAKTLLPAMFCIEHASIGIVLYSDVLDVEYHNRSLHSQSPICGEWFSDRDAVIRDYRSSHPVLYCHACKRLFHHPFRVDSWANGVQCANAACGRMFRTRGALVQHLESGRCESGVDMGEVDKFFSGCCDQTNLFVDKNLSAPGTQTDNVPHDETSDAVHNPYICPSKKCRRKRFFSLARLTIHLETGCCGLRLPYEISKLIDQLIDITDRL
ncbi:hypothetical protein PSHT_06261, partial [Puccinia striiformis]